VPKSGNSPKAKAKQLTTYILRRLTIIIPVLFAITVLDFTFLNMAPGDPIMAMMMQPGESPGEVDYENVRRLLGLDKPAPVRYGIWLGQVVRGNLGYSYTANRPVLGRITARLPNTLLLTAAALSIALVIGVSVGIVSALRQYSLLDYVVTLCAFFGVSIPNFFFAIGMIWLFAVKLRLFPTFGTGAIAGDDAIPLLTTLSHLAMPALVLGLTDMAVFARYTRTSILEVLHQDYIMTARAKGLCAKAVILRHALRNGLLPIVTMLGVRIPGLFGGALIVETIFAWPGIGLLTIEAVRRLDYPQLMGIFLVFSLLVLLANLAVDIAYASVDPRIRYT
jgi:peptide/nickel transport system permease protein